MRVIAIKDIGYPISKKKGEIFEIPDGYARTYMVAGMVQRAKREYRRRDMTAENTRDMKADE